jgi:hypothetical protein
MQIELELGYTLGIGEACGALRLDAALHRLRRFRAISALSTGSYLHTLLLATKYCPLLNH